ncbi:radical SAM protein [Acidobacteriia bacterium AH_259_A11_L15]|nr:radical SAM protein [Acidobacteriia bacterium AH_259_A11_L15]
MQIPRRAKDFTPYVKKVVRPKRLESVFLFVTSRCNSLCRTCFYWDQLNKNQDLTFDQIKTVSETAPEFSKLWVSGGEPTMREDLDEIVCTFYRNNKIHTLNLPTNGLLPDNLDRMVGRILKDCPNLTIDLNFSIDGLANTHDTIRGVPNNFQKTLATMERMKEKYQGVRRLRRNVVTVITRENYDELVRLGLEILRRDNSAGQYFEIIRGNPMDLSLKNINRRELKALHDQLMRVHEAHADRLFANVDPKFRWFPKMYYLGTLKFIFETHEQNVERPQKWAMPCTAGLTSLVIDHNGEFRACEIRPAIGQLQDFNFDLSSALHSEAMQKEVKAIPEAHCWCTHSCWISDSLKFSPKVLLFKIPWSWLKHRLRRLPQLSVDDIQQFHEPLPVQ